MDRLVIDYLKGKNKKDNDYELMEEFKEFMAEKRRGGSLRHGEMHMPMRESNELFYREHDRMGDSMNMYDYDRPSRPTKHGMDDDMYRMIRYMKESIEHPDHFSEHEAKHIVSGMYHMENGRKHTGEHYNMSKAKEICERYRGILPTSVTPADVYIAVNAQYHDYSELLKSWFGDNIDNKVIESAIVFWFKDADYESGNKLANYFRG